MGTMGPEGAYTPIKILASRQYLENYTDVDSKVIQYDTQWTRRGGKMGRTWSTEETIRTHLLAFTPNSNQGWADLVSEWEGGKRRAAGEVTQKGPEEELLAGHPKNEQRYWQNVTHLQLHTRETNPDHDILGSADELGRQLRTEGDVTYCYEPDGKLIGVISTPETRELYNRYTQTVGDTSASGLTREQQATRLKLALEHRVQVGSFEEEVAQLLVRYSSKVELKQRRRNLQNHWTLPPEMMEAVHSAMGVKTEVFASPLNVHRDTTKYYSQYPRDAVFGAMGSAWEARWEDLGAYQFNPEYTAEDLHKALKKAVEATKQDKPVLGVGIYPTYAKTPYRKLLNKHMGYMNCWRIERGCTQEVGATQNNTGGERANKGQTSLIARQVESEIHNEGQQMKDWRKENGKGYQRPERRFDKHGMICTDGSQMKVETQWGDKEDVTAAGVWDPRKGRNKEHMQRWQGQCQTVNKAELTAILMALMLEENEDEEEVQACTDSLTSLYQIQNMRRRPHTLERHVHRDILWKIPKQVETLNKKGIKVALYKVKARVGIQGNEKADEVAKRACMEGDYALNHDNTETIQLVASCAKTGKRLEGRQAVLNHVQGKVSAKKQTGKSNVIQRMKRKLETGPEEWETKKQRVTRMEEERAKRDEGTIQREEEEGEDRNTAKQEDAEAQRILAEWDRLLWEEEEAKQNEPKGRQAGTVSGKREQHGETGRQTEPNQPEQIGRGTCQAAETEQESIAEIAKGKESPETEHAAEMANLQDTQREEEEETMRMARRQQEVQEKTRTRSEEAQQQADMQEKSQPTGGWRAKARRKIQVAVKEIPEKHMQHLRGDKAMHKISNGFWNKGAEYRNEKDVTAILRMPGQVNKGGFARGKPSTYSEGYMT
ncbi:hypothetical protein CYMTET_8688 [Cymbomonas tetramitiformis]|uniref:RNase H type-1 domain-containing protein n=1 Tax=Cymbomonas tetramitiformis TaxID=36881 RepID=A0AAE0GSI8_9CHLO|nr:hypothetical protein CYMTET_8688 [Cymbomonas tetramitiformis]